MTTTATLQRARPVPGTIRAEQPASRGFRADIQGLRAVAVLLVVLDHAGVRWLAGGYVGVDVFFVVSGFVITGSLLGNEHRHGSSLSEFYAARARRILPMATVVLLATVVASWHLLNFVRAERVVTDALWAGFFGANVHFSAVGTDYFAAGLPQSPLQHYWSLAVEEQFYLVWPLLLGLLIFGFTGSSRRSAGRAPVPTRRIALALGLVIAVSLLWSVKQTHDLPPAAFFSTLTRAWELAIGALLAIGAATIARVAGGVRAVLTWFGLLGVGASAALFTADTPFPGWAALLPVLSTAAIIAGGTGGSRGGTGLLLGLRPFQAIGNWSYSFYLWHWPILVIAAGYAERDLSLQFKLLVLLAALAVSFVTYRLIETPFRRSERLRRDRAASLLLWPGAIVVLMLVCLWATTSLRSEVDMRAAAADTEPPAEVIASGARAHLSTDPTIAAVELAVRAARAGKPIPADLSPALDKIERDLDYGTCFAGPGETTNEVCRNGDVTAGRSIAIIGDSHAMMWFPALDAIGKKHGWAVYPFLKPSCTSADVTIYLPSKGPHRECDQWRAWALKTAAGMRFDRVIVSNYPPSRLADRQGTEIIGAADWFERWRSGVTSTARTLRAGGAKVTFFGDVPGSDQDPTECLLRRAATMATCTPNILPTHERRNLATKEGAERAGAGFVNLDAWFCAAGQCPMVIGRRVAYKDGHHVSRTYALHLAEPLARKLGLTQ